MEDSNVFTGVINKVQVKQITEPSKLDLEYGNKFKISMEIGDEFFLLGSGKYESVSVRRNGDYVKLEVGDKVTFAYEDKEFGGKPFKCVKRSAIILINKGSGSPPEQQKAVSGSQPKVATSSVPYEAGIAVGHAINNAVHLLATGKGDVDLLRIKEVSKDILKISHDLKAEYADIIKGLEVTPSKERFSHEIL